jgi:hypothetical protein
VEKSATTAKYSTPFQDMHHGQLRTGQHWVEL